MLKYSILPVFIFVLLSCNKSQLDETVDDSTHSSVTSNSIITNYIVTPGQLEQMGETAAVRQAHSDKFADKRSYGEWLFQSLENGHIDIEGFDQLLSILYVSSTARFSELPEHHSIRATPEYVAYMVLKDHDTSFQMTNADILALKTPVLNKSQAAADYTGQKAVLIIWTPEEKHIVALPLTGCREDAGIIRLSQLIKSNGLKTHRVQSQSCK